MNRKTPVVWILGVVLAAAGLEVHGGGSDKEAKTKLDWKGDYPLSVPLATGWTAPEYQQLAVVARDRTKLAVHEWAPTKAKAGQPVVLLLHGIGMHGRPHGSVAAAFTSRQVVFIVPDLRGHGFSAGEREVLASPETLRSDLGEIIGLVNKRHPQSPFFLAGESMGGLMAADYGARGERRLDGLILLGPAFQVHSSQINLKDFPGALFGVELAKEAKLAPSTREPGFIKARLKDDKALRRVSTSYLLTLNRLQAQFPDAADKITAPFFLGLAGKDTIVEGKAAKAVLDRAATPKDQKTCRQWDEAFHTLCWDPLTPIIMEEVANWALAQSNPKERKKSVDTSPRR